MDDLVFRGELLNFSGVEVDEVNFCANSVDPSFTHSWKMLGFQSIYSRMTNGRSKYGPSISD